MPGRGPAPRPTALKVLSGNPGKRPLNKSEPQPRPGMEPPAWLDEAARVEWDRVMPELDIIPGLMRRPDAVAMAAYGRSIVQMNDANKVIRARGLTMKTANGIRIRPEVRAFEAAVRLIATFSQEFGLTPASRSRIHLTPTPEEDDALDGVLS